MKSSFGKNPKNPTHRISDTYDYKKILTEHGFRHIYGVQAGKLWEKTHGRTDTQQIGTDRTNTHIVDFEADELTVDDSESAEVIKHKITRGLEELIA
jgi:hypothetical protein